MTEIAWGLLEATLIVSLQASALIGALWLSRRALGKRIPVWVWTLGWALVWVRLAVPFNLEIPWSELGRAWTFKPVLAMAPWGFFEPRPEVGELMRTPVSQWQWGVLALWFTGALVVVVAMVKRALFWRDRLTRVERLDDGPLFDALIEGQDALGLEGPLSVWTARGLAAPVIHGIWRPRVMVPERFLGQLTPQQWRCVMAHELAHVKHRDVALGWLATVAMAMHWFNPLVWLAWRSAHVDRELAADARAMSCLDTNDQIYARTLLEVAKDSPDQGRQLAMAPGWRSSASVLRTRIVAAGRPRLHPRSKMGVAGAAALFVMGATMMTQSAPATHDTPIGWHLAGSGRPHYVVTMDREHVAVGNASARLEPKGPHPTGYSTLMQAVDATAWRGKRVRMSAVVRSEDVTQRGDMWARIQALDSPPDGPGLGGGGCDLNGTRPWRVCDVVLDVPQTAHTLQIGVGLSGPGKVWIDDARIEDVGHRVQLSGHGSMPTRPELQNGPLDQ